MFSNDYGRVDFDLFYFFLQCNIFSIEYIFNCFFRTGSEEVRKISSINWNIVCSNKAKGELGVQMIMKFNMALLGKWC